MLLVINPEFSASQGTDSEPAELESLIPGMNPESSTPEDMNPGSYMSPRKTDPEPAGLESLIPEDMNPELETSAISEPGESESAPKVSEPEISETTPKQLTTGSEPAGFESLIPEGMNPESETSAHETTPEPGKSESAPEVSEPEISETTPEQLTVPTHEASLTVSETRLIRNPVPDVLIPSDPEDGTAYAIIVEKETQQLFLYSNNGTPEELYRMNCSTGKVVGAKEHSGDLKTPEGVYFFTKKYKDRELAPIYGIRAFDTDYPNLMDRMAGRTGNDIWLHGTNKPLKGRDSSGCVALENSDLDEITKYISLKKTPMIIVRKLSYETADKRNIRETILSMLSEWRGALENESYHKYLKFYAPEYLPDISWWPEWNNIRKTIHISPQPFSVELKNILIARHDEVYVVLSEQIIKFSDRVLPAGTRKFYFSGNPLRIIAEEYLEPGKKGKKADPFVTAYRHLKPKDDKDDIADMVDDWLKAWSSKSIKRYKTYYASDFRSQGMNLREWLRHKKRLNKKYRKIRVTRDDLSVKESKQRRIVSFVQTYRSDNFKAVGKKQLVLKRENGKWKIYRETWEKI
ncbi:L,D-transpeptidase family protein [Desulfococcaceae bacterium HSG8]|nr:L,D-transpeptidase family protein [Desulfococcaceae bacterium HSG8]